MKLQTTNNSTSYFQSFFLSLSLNLVGIHPPAQGFGSIAPDVA